MDVFVFTCQRNARLAAFSLCLSLLQPSVCQSRTLSARTHWLTRGYELLKVSLTSRGMSAEFPTACRHVCFMYGLMYRSRSRVWPPLCLLFILACDEWTVLPRPDLYHDVNRFGHSAVFSDRWCFMQRFTTSSLLDASHRGFITNIYFFKWLKYQNIAIRKK